MKLLHTSDVHIRQVGDERWQALEHILELASHQQVDVVVIAGDLFDANYQANQVRGEIRELFKQFGKTVLLIPGNHDYQAYQDGYDWGSNTHVFLNAGEYKRIDNIFFWGIPYFKGNEEDVANLITRLDAQACQLNAAATHVLLFHGELLDISGNFADYAEDNGPSYLPVSLALFKGRIWQYVLAGHFHSTFQSRKIENGKFFVYPGSPVSITRKETGPRKVNLFRVNKPPDEYILQTPYFHSLSIEITPDDNWTAFVQRLKKQLASLPHYAKPIVHVNGMFDSQKLKIKEDKLIPALLKEFPAIEIETYKAIDLHYLLSDDLFKPLQQKIEQHTQLTTEQRQLLRNFLIEVMREERR